MEPRHYSPQYWESLVDGVLTEEVSRRRFLNQYRGKGPDSPLRINRDILNITGATVSSRAVTLGVKKVLAAFRVLGIASASGPRPPAR